jgi:hypothetical protein
LDHGGKDQCKAEKPFSFTFIRLGSIMEEMVRSKLAILGPGGFFVDRAGLWRKVLQGGFWDGMFRIFVGQ